MSALEIFANAMTVVCIFLAGRNNVHTWWTGIVSCIAFGVLFFQANLYADVTLQVFFVITSIIGWMQWTTSKDKNDQLPMTTLPRRKMISMVIAAIGVAVAYGLLLHKYTNAYAPAIDSLVMTFSIIGQLLLMDRRIQNWPVWVFVNLLSAPLYYFRELYITAGLYTVFFFHALYAWNHWRNLSKQKAA